MKKVFIIVLAVALVLTLYAKSESNNKIKADEISIFYGVSSYAMFDAEQAVIDDLLNEFSSLKFKKTTEELDLKSAFNVGFYYEGKKVTRFWVDKHGVFWLNGGTQGYRVSSGKFDYAQLKAIYEGSRGTLPKIKLPAISVTPTP